MRISDWSSDVCSSDLPAGTEFLAIGGLVPRLATIPARIAERVIGGRGGGDIGGAANGVRLAEPHRRIANRPENPAPRAGRKKERHRRHPRRAGERDPLAGRTPNTQGAGRKPPTAHKEGGGAEGEPQR